MRIFTNEEKLKAIELFIQYDFSPGAVITQIGYPAHRSVSYRWYKAYKANGNGFPEKLKRGRSKYTEEQKRIAVDYYLSHGKSLKKTINALGYPGTTCLCEWLFLARPFCRFGGEDKNLDLMPLIPNLSYTL